LVQRAIPVVISGNLGGWLYSAPNRAILACNADSRLTGTAPFIKSRWGIIFRDRTDTHAI